MRSPPKTNDPLSQPRFSHSHSRVYLSILLCFYLFLSSALSQENILAKNLQEASGFKKGLCIQIGLDDPSLTATLANKDHFLVHGIDPDEKIIEQTRQSLRHLGLYGQISVMEAALTPLPYADNLVNLVVAKKTAGLSLKEIYRVLSPNGILLLKSADLNQALREAGFVDTLPLPKQPGWVKTKKPRPQDLDEWPQYRYNADGNAVSQDLQVKPPSQFQWIQGPIWPHAWANPVRGAVSAGGRLFYSFNETPAGLLASEDRQLIARDAFNGLLLWKQPVQWRFSQMGLIATKELVFAQLKKDSISALNATTGESIWTYECKADLFKYKNELLIVGERSSILIIKAHTGELLWKKNSSSRSGNFLVSDRHIYYIQKSPKPYLVCLDLEDGKEFWRKEVGPWGLASNRLSVDLVFHHEGLLLLATKKSNVSISAETGEVLWIKPYKAPGHGGSQKNVFYAGGYVWVHPENNKAWSWQALDPKSGAVKKELKYKPVTTKNTCYPYMATESYLISNRTDFMDITKDQSHPVNFARGSCSLGLIPANGLTYAFPHECKCLGGYVRGFLGLTSSPAEHTVGTTTNTPTLETGPAYGLKLNDYVSSKKDWPTWRYDSTRSGISGSTLASSLKILWTAEVGQGLSSPAISEGTLLVASVKNHLVSAFDAKSGLKLWSYTALAGVNTPPTIYKGLVLFGSNSGWVTCLRLKDGALVWRFNAAPENRYIIAYNQLASTWPVHGSILIQDGVACFAAGRTSRAERGIIAYGLNPLTGEELWRDTPTGRKGGTTCDIMTGNSGYVYMKGWARPSKNLSKQRKPNTLPLKSSTGNGGLLDYSWYKRRLISGGPTRTSASKFIFNEKESYGITLAKEKKSRREYARPGKNDYELFAQLGKNRKPVWTSLIPIRVTSLIATSDTLLLSGPPADLSPNSGVLWTLSKKNGNKLNEIKLDSPAVDDGMAVAYGYLYIASQDGKILCLGEKK